MIPINYTTTKISLYLEHKIIAYNEELHYSCPLTDNVLNLTINICDFEQFSEIHLVICPTDYYFPVTHKLSDLKEWLF